VRSLAPILDVFSAGFSVFVNELPARHIRKNPDELKSIANKKPPN
jgi:hypothetical protein